MYNGHAKDPGKQGLREKQPFGKPASGQITRKSFLIWSAVLAATIGIGPACMRFPAGADERRLPRLDRENLLIYYDENGEIKSVQNRVDWQYRRRIILEGMQEVMGKLPGGDGEQPDFQVLWETDEGSYVIRHIHYEADIGERVPAFLLIPKAALRGEMELPAVLSPLGTGQSSTTFDEEGLENEIFPVWNDHRDWPRELAEQGYVTLIPAYPHLGAYRPDLKDLGYKSGTMKAIRDNIRGIDLLDDLPYVRSGKYGSIGHSLGGHNSIYTAVFDERIEVVVTSCGFDSYLDYMGGDISGWVQERYMPRIAEYELEEIPFDFHEMIAALAPRVCYVNAPISDSNFKWRSAAAVVETAMQIYNLFEVPERLVIEHPEAEHTFPEDQRRQAYRLLDRYLR